MFNDLPIAEVLTDLCEALQAHTQVVIQAPPGAGKTTAVPLALLQKQINRYKILVLEPRRMAAKNVATRMASLLGEAPGQTVGYRVRHETKVSPKSQIEVVTGGVFLRMLQSDPGLEAYDIVIFDEFHERSLDADLSLALCLQGRDFLRENAHPLKLLLMSATLDAEPIQQFLGSDTPLITSAGRSYPVQTRYLGRAKPEQWLEHCAQAVKLALVESKGDILLFLPGQKEIRQLERTLQQNLGTEVVIKPLYGALALSEQQAAIEPLANGQRKVVLATDIAETSLTIQGIGVVIDSGLRRQPQFDPKSAMTRLSTSSISRASAEQRAGRAGRLGPGLALRLWPKEQSLEAYNKPEIEQADLLPLALKVLAWGASEVDELQWLTSPPKIALAKAYDVLLQLGAIEPRTNSQKQPQSSFRLLAHGEAMAKFPAHPRLAHMILEGQKHGLVDEACMLAALLSEPGAFNGKQRGKPLNSKGDLADDIATDLESQLNHLLGLPVKALKQFSSNIEKTFEQFKSAAGHGRSLNLSGAKEAGSKKDLSKNLGLLIALAYPERIAQKRQQDGQFLLANGRGARLANRHSYLTSCDYLAIAELGGTSGQDQDRIYEAVPLDPSLFNGPLNFLLKAQTLNHWSITSRRFEAEEQTKLGSLVLSSHKLKQMDSEARVVALIELLQSQNEQARGEELLHWGDEVQNFLARCRLAKELELGSSEAWPDLSAQWLTDKLNIWLAPFLTPIKHLDELQRLELTPILRSQLSWHQQQILDQLLPTSFDLPSGRSARIDYQTESPVIAAKLQEFFGLSESPKVAQGRLSLVVHLLSPAGRPLQVTQDLGHFWKTSYQEVKKEMKGRYPKHPWPDDPLTAQASHKTKRHLKPD